MGGVEHDRPAGLRHLRQAAEVRRPACCSRSSCRARRAGSASAPSCSSLRATWAMSQGARNWPFLTCTRGAGRGRGGQQVGLAAEERRDLQHVDRLGHRPALLALVDVGQHRAAVALAHLGQDLDALGEAEAARAVGAGPVGLVERALVDQPEPARAAISTSAAAVSSACSRLSIWHGPRSARTADRCRSIERADLDRRRLAMPTLTGHVAQAATYGRGSRPSRGAAIPAEFVAQSLRSGSDCSGSKAPQWRQPALLTRRHCESQAESMTGVAIAIPFGAAARACPASDQPRLVDGGLDERGEQRVRRERLRLQLGVELHADEPGVVGHLDDLGQAAVGRHAGEAQARRAQAVDVVDVDLVAVAVALADLDLRRRSCARGCRGSRMQG